MGDTLSQLKDVLPLLVPLIAIQVILLVVALVDLVRREAVTGGNKIVWALAVCLISIIGPAVYLLAGRKENTRESD